MSIFWFPDYNLSINGFSQNLVCTLILWKSGLELLMGKFCHILTESSAWHISVDLFLDDSLSIYQLIFTKLCMCINIVEIWFGIANGQILSVFDRVICPSHVSSLVVG